MTYSVDEASPIDTKLFVRPYSYTDIKITNNLEPSLER